MARTKYIKGRNGKFVGSIGAGKANVPTAGQRPRALEQSLTDLAARQGDVFAPFTAKPVVAYDAHHESLRVAEAMAPARGLFARRRQAALRRQLEAQFGQIDWSDTADAEPAAGVPMPYSTDAGIQLIAPTPAPKAAPRAPGTSLDMLRAHSGKYGTTWVRIAGSGDQQFLRAGGSTRMLLQGPRAVSNPDSPFYGRAHVLIQYGTQTQRYNIDDVSFTPSP